jgi:hypothetical protein
MPGLTVTEKQHWKERLARRVDRKIEALGAEEPNLMDRVQREARQRALESLGLAELQAELDAIEEQEQALEKRKERSQKAMLARVQGVPVEDVESGSSYYQGDHHPEVSRALQRRQAVHEEELLAESPIGQQILRLRREKEELLDTVWLATSSKQIKELWQKVAELLGDESSPLQAAALAIEPVQEG